MIRRRNWKSRNRERGFTLVELIAVTIILALLAGGAVLGIVSQVEKARKNATISEISTIGSALDTFHLDCGFYAGSLEDLIRAPVSGRTCKGYAPGGYFKKKEIPKDAWGNPYNYLSPGVHSPDSYDLWSNGPDAEDGTSDDLASWATESAEE